MTPAEEALLDRLAADNSNLRQIIDHQVERNLRLRWTLEFILGVDRIDDAHVAARSALEEKE